MTVLDPQVQHPGSNQEPPEVAHVVKKGDVTDAMVFGIEVEAICGHRFIPTRDPEGYPLCEGCKRVLLERITGS